MMYRWDIKSWIERNTGTRLRVPVWIAWVNMHLASISELYADFVAKATDLDDKVKYNSQQLVLQSFLNKKFDPTGYQIRVETVSDAWEHPVIYYESEAKENPAFYYESEGEESPAIRYESEKILNGLFRVFVPTALSSKESEIKSWLEYFKEASKTYEIVYI